MMILFSSVKAESSLQNKLQQYCLQDQLCQQSKSHFKAAFSHSDSDPLPSPSSMVLPITQPERLD